jgi:undecaprenyl diphosphate synthase
MDGNGRWALMRQTERTEGHRAAEAAVYSSVHGALNLGVEWLSLYAFSTENWRRNPAEISFLMDFSEWLLHETRVEERRELGVRIRFVGRLDDERIPQRSRDTAASPPAPHAPASVVAFNFGSRADHRCCPDVDGWRVIPRR